MEYRVHKIIHNANFWQKPSPGRLGKSGFGSYVEEHGFGHEDWNFNVNHAFRGYIYGYTRAMPARRFLSERFNIIHATWDSENGWMMVGHYQEATYAKDGGRLSHSHRTLRREQVRALAMSHDLGGSYAQMTAHQIDTKLIDELRFYNWKVAVPNVFLFDHPIQIPKSRFNPGRQRLTTSFQITRKIFETLIALARNGTIAATEALALEIPIGTESRFPEGTLKTRLHTFRERDLQLIRKAKAEFVSKHGRLFCQACGFDFQATYGERFIEAHHMLVPVNQLTGDGARTNPSHLAMVCANCHRMLHRKRPWISTIEKLPSLLAGG